jgi:hypothetical protein
MAAENCKWHEMHGKMLEQVRIVRDFTKSSEDRRRARIRFEFWYDQRNAVEVCNRHH